MSVQVAVPFTSPFLHWYPYADGLPTAGWNASGTALQLGATSPLGADSSTSDAFRWTSAGNSSMALTFNGTAVSVHGTTAGAAAFNLAVDGLDPSSSGGSGQLGDLLGSFSSLDSDKEHTLTFNMTAADASSWASISEVILTVPTNGQANITYDDADLSHWLFKGAWGTGAAASAGTYLQTSTYTQDKGATATVNFTGSAVYLFGSIQPDHGLYTVQVDGGPIEGPFDGKSRRGFTQQLLFFGSGYDKDAFHELVVTDVDGTKLDVDYVVVLGPTNNARTRRIAGITVGATCAAAIAGGVIWWIWRTERNGRRKMNEYVRAFVDEKSRF